MFLTLEMLKLAKEIFQCFALITSIILNTILTYLILTKSNVKMGSYKYIMMYLSISALCYSVLGLIVRPDLLSYSSCFAVFTVNSKAIFNSTIMIYLMSIICGFYFFFAALIAVHFVYRYFSLKHGSKWKYFQGKSILYWFLLPLLFYANWTTNCLLVFQPNNESTEFLRNHTEKSFGLSVEEITYIIADFYPVDENGESRPSMWAFLSGANFLIMATTSLSVIIVFGIKCYIEMNQVVLASRQHSITHKVLQTQLFRALVFQTLIPLFIMFIPLFILFIFPMLKIGLGVAHYISLSISLYPALDALPSLLFIRDYRDSLVKCVKRAPKSTTTQNHEAYHMRTGSVTASSSRKDTVHVSRVD